MLTRQRIGEASTPLIDRAVFIVGLPRSGTTLAASILAAHPSFAVSAETHFLDLWVPSLSPNLRGEAAILELLGRFCEYERFPQFGIDAATLHRRVAMERASSPAALFSVLLDEVRRARGRARIVEKTPDHDQQVETLLSWYPDCRIVWMVRDPRGVLASMRRLPWSVASSPRVLAARWRDSVRRLERRVEDGRFLGVRYESLVAEPEREIRRLCGFLGEEFHPELLAGGRPMHYATTVSEWGRMHLEHSRGPIDQASVERWRQELEPDEVGLLELLTGRALNRWGYRPTERLRGLRGGLRTLVRAARRRLGS